jgi:hypothetical protein
MYEEQIFDDLRILFLELANPRAIETYKELMRLTLVDEAVEYMLTYCEQNLFPYDYKD